ncbi:MAG: histidine kinase dimerization/phosphoacceptor domain -containing protein [Candidatus Poribacteria bacterium]
MNEPIRILHIDDNRLDRELVRDALEKEHGGFRITEATSREEFEALLLEDDFDCVLSDLNILGFEGLQALDAVQIKDPQMLVIIVTASGSEEVAVEAMKRGAADYVIKTPKHIQKLPHIIQAAIEKKRLWDENKRAEQALRERQAELSAIYNNAPVIMALVDGETRVRKINDAIVDFNGRHAEAVIGFRIGEALRCLHALNDPNSCGVSTVCGNCQVPRILLDTFEKGKIHHQVEAKIPFVSAAGEEERNLLISTTPLNFSVGRVVLVCLEDITKLKQAEEQIKASLREKEVLLREIHHRVKNNLQIVSSLLDMSGMRTDNQEAINFLNDARSRIHTMALIHSQLYGSDRFDNIDVGSQIRGLVRHLSEIYPASQRVATNVIEHAEVHLSITLAIPLSLALNELITNAFKHAFKERRRGRIDILINQSAGETALISVKDDGIGMPEYIDIDSIKTLGLSLVRNLVKEQLKGQINLERDNGTEITIEIPILSQNGG